MLILRVPLDRKPVDITPKTPLDHPFFVDRYWDVNHRVNGSDLGYIHIISTFSILPFLVGTFRVSFMLHTLEHKVWSSIGPFYGDKPCAIC